MRNITKRRRQSAFTLIELVVTITILGILGFTALTRFVNVHDAAHTAVVDGVVASLRTGASFYRSYWFTQGSPPGTIVLDVEGLPVRYRDGQVVRVNTLSHIPVGTPHRNSASARIFFLFLAVTPSPIIPRNPPDTGTGWVMLANNQCDSVTSRCWEYRVSGNREARITYVAGEDGRIIVD